MMNPNKSLAPVNSASTSLSFKLAALFGISFLAFFVIFFAYDLLSSFAESSAARGNVSEQAPPIVIDPKIATDLSKVLTLDVNANSDAIKDPFSDRGGLSGRVGGPLSAKAVLQTNAASKGAPSAVSAFRGQTATGTARSGVGASVTGSPVESTKERYETWFGRFGLSGDATLDPRIFSIEDLLPVGIVDGGSGQQEVMFFSEATGRTLSFPVGTLFFDGWLSELRPEGVVFSSNDDRRTVRMRSWARSIKTAG
jgi:hypothetical protein